MNSRLKHIYARLKKESLDALILSSPYNITYLTNFRSHESYLVISKKKNIYFADSRYIEQAKKSISACGFKKIDGPVFKIIADASRRLKFKRIGFEERYLSLADYQKIKEEFKKTASLVPTRDLIEELRQIKSQGELEKIVKSTQISIAALRFIKDIVSVGKKEREIAAELERFIRYNGAYASAFDIIVASGLNSCFPHHITSQRKIQNNEPVLIDVGVDYDGYKSDLTRVFFLGKISSNIRKVYGIVHRAQEKAIGLIKPSVFINKVDRVARQYIAQRGYGGFFGHSLGHGIGLEVHEYPRISTKEKGVLKEGMVFTIEPAIYLPGRFGIRIEDMVLVTKKGCKVLSGTLDK